MIRGGCLCGGVRFGVPSVRSSSVIFVEHKAPWFTIADALPQLDKAAIIRGCAPFGFGTDPSGKETAPINVRCLDGVDLGALTKVSVDGRSR